VFDEADLDFYPHFDGRACDHDLAADDPTNPSDNEGPST
jgi:hypothetical protein